MFILIKIGKRSTISISPTFRNHLPIFSWKFSIAMQNRHQSITIKTFRKLILQQNQWKGLAFAGNDHTQDIKGRIINFKVFWMLYILQITNFKKLCVPFRKLQNFVQLNWICTLGWRQCCLLEYFKFRN